MPRKGTETQNGREWTMIDLSFGNEMPRKGTETSCVYNNSVIRHNNLEMRCPGRGRKRRLPGCSEFLLYLEMRCPGRGRKLWCCSVYLCQLSRIWKWDAPEGDGNAFPRNSGRPTGSNLEMRCPGRGRKPILSLWKRLKCPFGNEMPRKGTETNNFKTVSVPHVYLEMRCPGRGRKHNILFSRFNWALIWKWDAPEGDGNRSTNKDKEIPLSHLEMRCPGRGRKHYTNCRNLYVSSIWKWDAPEGDGNSCFLLFRC